MRVRLHTVTLFSAARAPWLAAGALAAVLFASGGADAKSAYESSYGFDRTWNAAIRLLRVDLGLKLTEKDEGSGYLLFEYRSPEGGSKASSGSIEVVRPKDKSEPARVFVQLAQMPRYHEQVMMDALVKKLRAEYGDPPARPHASEKSGKKEPAHEGEGEADAGTEADAN